MSRNIRSGQLLTPFGIGQIVNFPDEESLMICGLDNWDRIIDKKREEAGAAAVDEREFIIRDRRLENLLGVEKFKSPWAFKKAGRTNVRLSLPAIRFPGWHYCSVCGLMIPVSPDLKDVPRCMNVKAGKTCNGKLLSVRFVAVCQAGHIQDVPFSEWVHRGYPRDNNNHHLRYESGTGSGDLSSIIISCSCGERRSLAGLLNSRKIENIIVDSALSRIGLGDDDGNAGEQANGRNPNGQYCRGYRPWLWPEGVTEAQNCGAHLQVMIKGGSNIHYSSMISALYLPDDDDENNPVYEKMLERLTAIGLVALDYLRLFYDQDESGNVLSAVLGTFPEVQSGQITVQEIVTILKDKFSRPESGPILPSSGLELRKQEYACILKGKSSENGNFKALKYSFDNYASHHILENYFESVVLIEKLKETRVFKGFSRINAVPEGPSSGFSADISLTPVTWLPAIQVYGEGVFLKFREDKLDQWTAKVAERNFSFIARYSAAQQKRYPGIAERDINPIFVMMHTFSHLLIKRLCFNCGYGSSSLREKIYYSSDLEQRMNGILIYTSSGDAEGSMGGLVRQGTHEYLGNLIRDAIEDSRWCSADPVCSDVGQSSGQGPDNVNGAACHNCCIVPETSCEEFNMMLDRSTLCGTLSEPELGFFTL